MKTIFRRCFPGPVTKNLEFFTIPTSPPIRKSRLPIAHTRREKRVEICTYDTPWPPHKRGLSWLLPRLGECAAPRSRGLPALSKASPGGEAGATLVATDEVEANDYHHRMVRRCYLRPHPVRLWPDHLPLQGKVFFCPVSPYVDFCSSGIGRWRAGHAAAPTLPRRECGALSCFPL